jgi:hypothetical protein
MRRHFHHRRGDTTMMTLVGLSVLLLVLAVVIDLGRMALARKQMQSLADAAALGAAGELHDQSVLFPGRAGERMVDRLIDAPATRAGERGLAIAEEALKQRVLADQTTMPKGQLRTGYLDADGRFVASDNQQGCSAVEVQMGFSTARQNSLPLFVTRWFGAQAADVEVVSVATIDQRLVGFRPRGNSPSPVVPLVLNQEAGGQGWYQQATALTNGFNDRFTAASDGLVGAGEDGIPELVFRFSTQSAGDGASAWRTQIGADRSSWNQQMQSGLSAADLASHGGLLDLQNQGQWRAAHLNASVASDEILKTLRELTGQPRVWPLGQAGQGQVKVTGFAAGQVVECWDEGNGWIAVSIQPCTLTTDTAIVSEDAPENPWIGKVVLSH